MRIISWNVNGLRAIANKGFAQWLQEDSPDIICLQETKARPDQLNNETLEIPLKTEGFWQAHFASAQKPGYSGVAIYSKTAPLDIRYMGFKEFDAEGRVLIAEYPTFTLINAYFPNSQEGGARLDYKLAFCTAMREVCDNLVASNRNLVLCGDYNIAHRPIDLANPKANEKNPGYLPEERAWMEEFLAAGYTDSFRSFYPDLPEKYSWWSYRFKAREKNIGWRIDYHCVNKGFAKALKAAHIRSEVMGSDHCPVEIILGD